MSDIDVILRPAEILFREKQMYFHEEDRMFYLYGRYHAVADALEEALPGWNNFVQFLGDFGELHDEVMESSFNQDFQNRSPCGKQIMEVLALE